MPHLPHFLPVFLLGTLFLGSSAGATNCAFSSFEQTLKTADAVVQVEVVQQNSKATGPQTEFQARVIAVYAGKVQKGDLHILGAAGLDTYLSVQQFPPGTRWVMALDTHDLRGNTLPKTVYAPAGCVRCGPGRQETSPGGEQPLEGGMPDALTSGGAGGFGTVSERRHTDEPAPQVDLQT